jgi:biopolymer transport protein ExbB
MTLLLAGLVLAVPTSTAFAQDAAESTSFAEAFFISYSTDASGEQGVEWLGSLVIWTLMATSIASLGLIGQLAFAFKREKLVPEPVVSRATDYLQTGRFREALTMLSEPGSESDFATVLKASLERASGGHEAMQAGLEQAATEVMASRVRRVEILNVIGQVSPMLGLFGTVYGMILAFQSIVTSGGNADPVLLAGGIGTALVTTFWGLVVAIPALAGYAVLRGRLDATLAEAFGEAETLVERFRPRASRDKDRERSSSSSSSSSSRDKEKDKDRSSSSSSSRDKDRERSSSSSSRDKDRERSSSSSSRDKDKEKDKERSSSSSSRSSRDKERSSRSRQDEESSSPRKSAPEPGASEVDDDGEDDDS